MRFSNYTEEVRHAEQRGGEGVWLKIKTNSNSIRQNPEKATSESLIPDLQQHTGKK